MTQEQGRGTVRTVRDRAGNVIGYQALLPREHSKPPPDCKRPDLYQQPVGPRLDDKGAARRILDAAILERLDAAVLSGGLPFSSHLRSAIKAKQQDARRRYGSEARASKALATWRSVDRRWLSRAPFYDLSPEHIDLRADLQPWFDWLRDEAETLKGEPLSGPFIRHVAGACRAVFERAGIEPNPARSLKLPPKGEPRVPNLEIGAQRRVFTADGEDGIDLADRVMFGCGMGSGLRIGELLPFEPADVRTEDRDPHLMVRYGGPDHSPPKGNRIRRVELFEPGLGFWRLWMANFYRGSSRVFAGRNGGYRKEWPERFPGWAEIAGVARLSSHIMRHTYAVSMLSGTWGYEPKSLEFVSEQLGHADLATTDRYYGAFEAETWKREVRRMTGRGELDSLTPITALQLLGLEGSTEGSSGTNGDETPFSAPPPLSTQNAEITKETGATEGSTPQSAVEALRVALGAVETDDPLAFPKLIVAAGRALRELEAIEAEALPSPASKGRSA